VKCCAGILGKISNILSILQACQVQNLHERDLVVFYMYMVRKRAFCVMPGACFISSCDIIVWNWFIVQHGHVIFSVFRNGTSLLAVTRGNITGQWNIWDRVMHVRCGLEWPTCIWNGLCVANLIQISLTVPVICISFPTNGGSLHRVFWKWHSSKLEDVKNDRLQNFDLIS